MNTVELNDYSQSTTVPSVRKSTIQEIFFPLPPLPEQHRIVAKIESLFQEVKTARESLSRIQPMLKSFRQSVLAKAFRGELVPQNPEDEPASVLLERIKAERKRKLGKKYKEPEAVDAQGLGELPAGWVLCNIDDASEHIVDCLHSTPKFTQEGEYCIDTTCISPRTIHFDRARCISSESFLDRVRRLEPQSGDILFSREGTIGTAAIVPDNVKLCLGQRMMMFRTHNEIDSLFFMNAIMSRVFQLQYKPKIIGTTAPHLNIGDIKNMFIPLPPLPEQHRIVAKIEELFAIADQIEQQAEAAKKRTDRMEQAILAKAFRGELVAQYAGDEPASELLERIRKERRKM
jgi:type I restriction enzyme S subunit